jgi:hypothetical protein
MKKAMTIQFNWVFVLIAGALILLFFGSIIMKQRDLSERSASQDTVLKLEKKLGVSLTEIGKSEEMDFQGRELTITCNELRSGKATTTLTDPIFSPQSVKGTKLITLTKAFKMPFHIANFLYVTSNNVRYIIVYDSSSDASLELAEDIMKDLGGRVSTELRSDLSTVEDSGHYKTKIVFANTSTTPVALKGDVKAVQILEDLTFYTLKGNDWEEEAGDGQSFYLSRDLEQFRETILGAIFAEDKETYECLLKKAIKKLNMMSKLYIQRTLELASPECDYSHAGTYLMRIEEKSAILSNSLDQDEINRLKENSNRLETQNNLMIMNSCPEIY